jgi:hypothetical protein
VKGPLYLSRLARQSRQGSARRNGASCMVNSLESVP